MKKLKILITSDDGYDSLGVRLLVRFLSDKYELKTAGTKEQMSGVGGKLTMKGGSFFERKVGGVPAVVVDGTPADAVQVAESYWNERFDWVVSGINWGANIGSGLISSGTFAAAYRALGIGLTERAIAVSWMVEPKYWLYQHDESMNHLEERFGLYPGAKAVEMVELAIRENNWGVPLVNINLPPEPADTWLFTKTLSNLNHFYAPAALDFEKKVFEYPTIKVGVGIDEHYDAGALLAGKISITPCIGVFEDELVLNRLTSV